jgi:hypothetical protein
MSLFKILKGSSSRISKTSTPFHDGYAYLTPDDGGFYIDAEHDGIEDRIRINPDTVSKATTLETARTIALSDTVYGTATSFDGSTDITIPVTLVDGGTF